MLVLLFDKLMDRYVFGVSRVYNVGEAVVVLSITSAESHVLVTGCCAVNI